MINNILILFAILLSGILIVFIINSVFNSFLKSKLSENESNISVDILKSICFISGGLLLSEMATSFYTMIKVLLNIFYGTELLMQEVMFFSIYLGIVLLLLLVIFSLTTLLFGAILKGKKIFNEVANNNISATILFCGIFLALSLVAKSGIIPVLDQFIPFPVMPIYH